MKFTRFQVEEHIGGVSGVGRGSRTAEYRSRAAAIAAMVAARDAGNGATCIARSENGNHATLYRLTRGNRLVKAL